MDQRFAAFGAGYGAARAPGTTVAAGVMPDPFCVLCRLWFGRGDRVRRSDRGILALMVGRVVNQGGTAFGTSDCRAGTAGASLSASVMPDPFGILGRFLFWCGLGGRSGGWRRSGCSGRSPGDVGRWGRGWRRRLRGWRGACVRSCLGGGGFVALTTCEE